MLANMKVVEEAKESEDTFSDSEVSIKPPAAKHLAISIPVSVEASKVVTPVVVVENEDEEEEEYEYEESSPSLIESIVEDEDLPIYELATRGAGEIFGKNFVVNRSEVVQSKYAAVCLEDLYCMIISRKALNRIKERIFKK